MQQALVLALALVAASVATGFARQGAWAWAALTLMAPLAVHVLALAAEFAWMRRANRREPQGAPGTVLTVRAWLAEARAALSVFGWRQPFRSQRCPDHPRPADATAGQPGSAVAPPPAGDRRRGVLLVHGFVCNRGLWLDWMERLSALGVPYVAVNLEPVFGPIDDYAGLIDDAVRTLEQTTGVAPVAVAHSMGGLAVRHWWAGPGRSERLHHLVTLGTPHGGTMLARLALPPNARQMRLRSPWLRDLAAHDADARRQRMTCYYSRCDNIVFPASSATLPGADNRPLDGSAHIAMIWRPEPFEHLLRLLADAPAGTGPVPDQPAASTPRRI